MKIDDKATAALREPDTKAITFELTPERKEKFAAICSEIFDLLKHRTDSPLEAYSILHFLLLDFEDSFGIRGGIVMEHGDRTSS